MQGCGGHASWHRTAWTTQRALCPLPVQVERVMYNAPNEASALSELEKVKEKWGRKYPYAISSWENN